MTYGLHSLQSSNQKRPCGQAFYSPFTFISFNFSFWFWIEGQRLGLKLVRFKMKANSEKRQKEIKEGTWSGCLTRDSLTKATRGSTVRLVHVCTRPLGCWPRSKKLSIIIDRLGCSLVDVVASQLQPILDPVEKTIQLCYL